MVYAALVLRFDLGFAFAIAGLAKLRDRKAFIQAVFGYKLVSDRVAVGIGRLLPPVEGALGLLLLLGLGQREAAAAVAVLLGGFSAAIGVNLARGRKIDCGCSGGSGVAQTITWWTVVRNVGLLGASVVVAVAGSSNLALDALVLRSNAEGLSTTGSFALLIVALSLLVLAQLTVGGRRLRAAMQSPTLKVRGVFA